MSEPDAIPAVSDAATSGEGTAQAIAQTAEVVAAVAGASGDAPVAAVAAAVADVAKDQAVDADVSDVATLAANAAASALESGEVETHGVMLTLHAAVVDVQNHLKTWWHDLDADVQAGLLPLTKALGIQL